MNAHSERQRLVKMIRNNEPIQLVDVESAARMAKAIGTPEALTLFANVKTRYNKAQMPQEQPYAEPAVKVKREQLDAATAAAKRNPSAHNMAEYAKLKRLYEEGESE